ncbi:MAG: Crp/Fnr family transcriptional regulator [Sphingomonas taxi]
MIDRRFQDRDAALSLWIRRLDVRSPMTDDDQRTIMNFQGRLEEFRPGRDIVRLGERTRQVQLIVRGTVARFGQVRDGNRQFTAFFISGDIADLHSAVMPVVSAPLQATGPVLLYRIPHEEIVAATDRSPTLARAFWRDCVADSQVAAEWLINIGQRDALTRLAHLLCELGCRYRAAGFPPGEFPLGLTQSELGAALGLTGVHVNRMMRRLRDEGLIGPTNGHVEILDWSGLARAGEFHPGYLHLEQETDR